MASGRPIMKYGNLTIMGASVTQLNRLDTIQNAATNLCDVDFFSSSVSLSYCRGWIVIKIIVLMLL